MTAAPDDMQVEESEVVIDTTQQSKPPPRYHCHHCQLYFRYTLLLFMVMPQLRFNYFFSDYQFSSRACIICVQIKRCPHFFYENMKKYKQFFSQQFMFVIANKSIDQSLSPGFMYRIGRSNFAILEPLSCNLVCDCV